MDSITLVDPALLILPHDTQDKPPRNDAIPTIPDALPSISDKATSIDTSTSGTARSDSKKGGGGKEKEHMSGEGLQEGLSSWSAGDRTGSLEDSDTADGAFVNVDLSDLLAIEKDIPDDFSLNGEYAKTPLSPDHHDASRSNAGSYSALEYPPGLGTDPPSKAVFSDSSNYFTNSGSINVPDGQVVQSSHSRLVRYEVLFSASDTALRNHPAFASIR